ncbi:hypothetical protein L0F63_004750 [Massospora cicadina]|nr:hypothetical protein L0F63_004750 [Massospora cicadina]
MSASPPILTPHNATTSISLAHATFDPLTLDGRPKLVRKKSGEIVKSALKMAANGGQKLEARSVHFPHALVRVRSFDKKQCPQSVSGYTPLSIRALNFSTNAHLFEHVPVCLEKVERDAENEQIVGTVLVANLDFQKKVVTRYTFDNWATFHSVHAAFSHSLAAGCNHDAFKFRIAIPSSMRVSDNHDTYHCLKFAIQYLVMGQEHWDNNRGRNYSVEITPAVELDPNLMDESQVILPSPDNAIFNQVKAKPQGWPKPVQPDSSLPSFDSSRSSFGSRYSLSTSLSKPTAPAPSKFGRSVKLESGSSPLSDPLYDATQLPLLPLNGSFFGWAKAQSSWFDSITLDDYQTRSSPVHSS